MSAQQSLADHLKLLLSLSSDLPVHTTESLRGWTGASPLPVTWPPPAGARGLWLVDTRDTSGRTLVDTFGVVQHAFDAALILSGSGQPGSLLRRLLRRIRRPGIHRYSEARVAGKITPISTLSCTRLGFKDEPGLSTDFELGGKSSSGAGFLLTRGTPFQGDIWKAVARGLEADTITVQSIHLRARGAAVSIVEARDEQFAVRMVADQQLQDVVRANHTALTRLRSEIREENDLLNVMPRPVLVSDFNGVLVLAETFLPGVLAWTIVSGRHGPAIYAQVLDRLDQLRRSTLMTPPSPSAHVDDLAGMDSRRLEQATFVPARTKARIEEELLHSSKALASTLGECYMSHGDFGYGNILVDPDSGRVRGIIDWDTARPADFPGIDRVNFEIQRRRGTSDPSFRDAVRSVWRLELAQDALEPGKGRAHARALFGVAICRYIIRAMTYPAIFARESTGFADALEWLASSEAV